MTHAEPRRVALVTGAAVRVGRSIALELADAGFDIALHHHHSEDAARQTADEIRNRGARAHLIRADLTRPGAPAQLIEDVLSAFGRLDALINSAAVFIADAPGTIDPSAARAQIELNLIAPMLLSCAAAEALADGDGGAIVNIADARLEQPMRGYLSYTAAKAGLVGLTRALARDLAPRVRVNAVAPGAVAFPDAMPAAQRELILSQVPLGRAGEPADVARAVRYLVCEAPFVTGQVLAIDGGRCLR